MANEEADPEITAMADVAGALRALNEEAKVRVLRWAADRYGLKDIKFGVNTASGGLDATADSRGDSSGNNSERPSFASIDELFESGVAKTNTQKALLAAYWFQVIQGGTGFQSYALNSALRNLGIGIANITDALGTAEASKPALVMQTGKTGKSKQARKTYKLTTAGVKSVEAMLTANVD